MLSLVFGTLNVELTEAVLMQYANCWSGHTIPLQKCSTPLTIFHLFS